MRGIRGPGRGSKSPEVRPGDRSGGTHLKYRWSAWKDSGTQTPGVSQPAASETETAPAFEAGTDIQVYRPPADDNWRAAWDVTERLIAKMNSEVRDHGAKFAVIIASNGVQVLPDKKIREDFAKKLGVDDLYYPNRRIALFAGQTTSPSSTSYRSSRTMRRGRDDAAWL